MMAGPGYGDIKKVVVAGGLTDRADEPPGPLSLAACLIAFLGHHHFRLQVIDQALHESGELGGARRGLHCDAPVKELAMRDEDIPGAAGGNRDRQNPKRHCHSPASLSSR